MNLLQTGLLILIGIAIGQWLGRSQRNTTSKRLAEIAVGTLIGVGCLAGLFIVIGLGERAGTPESDTAVLPITTTKK